MCILSFSQGHSQTCECDKCVPEGDFDLTDAVEEMEAQGTEMQKCLDGLKATEDLLWSVFSQLQTLKITTSTQSTNLHVHGLYQVLTPEALISAISDPSCDFPYTLEPAYPLPARIWKNSRFQMNFLIKNVSGKSVHQQLKFILSVYKCVLPIEEVKKGVHTKMFLRGKMVQTSDKDEVVFDKLSFGEVSSNYPEKSIRLVVTCRSPRLVQPFVSPPIKVISRF